MLRNPQTVNPTRLSLGPCTQKKIANYLYQPQRVLGRGSFSTVHPGIDSSRGHPVAVKVIRLASLNSPKLQDLLQQEISILCSMEHPNIIRCYQVLKSANHCYIITEICQQGNLETILRQKRRLSEDQAMRYARDIYQGLKYLAGQGIVHRDLKISNIFLKEGVVKIADFGFAVRARQRFYDLSIGSPLYMSPEGYIQKQYGPKTDLWAFGIILYQLLHGKTPFSHSVSDEDLKQRMTKGIDESSFNNQLSPQIKQLISRCLTVDQRARISIQELEAFFCLGGLMVANTPQSQRLGSRPPNRPISSNYGQDHALNEIPTNQQEQNILCVTNIQSARYIQSAKYINSSKQLPIEPIVLFISHNKEESATSTSSNAEESFDCSFVRGKVSFNEALGLIHFCRVGFQLLKRCPHEPIKGKIKQVIMRVLQDLQGKLKSSWVKFEVAEGQFQRGKKLKTVIKQYSQRYRAFPVSCGQNMDESGFQHLKQSLQQELAFLEHKQVRNQQEIYDMHLLMIFCASCQRLSQRLISQDYRFFAETTILEECLSNRLKFRTLGSYDQLKQKFYLSQPKQALFLGTKQ